MAALEERIRVAHEAGVAPERIASITRLEPEIVELIIAGRKPAVEARRKPDRRAPGPATTRRSRRRCQSAT